MGQGVLARRYCTCCVKLPLALHWRLKSSTNCNRIACETPEFHNTRPAAGIPFRVTTVTVPHRPSYDKDCPRPALLRLTMSDTCPLSTDSDTEVQRLSKTYQLTTDTVRWCLSPARPLALLSHSHAGKNISS